MLLSTKQTLFHLRARYDFPH